MHQMCFFVNQSSYQKRTVQSSLKSNKITESEIKTSNQNKCDIIFALVECGVEN
jgi:hypothetical protein